MNIGTPLNYAVQPVHPTLHLNNLAASQRLHEDVIARFPRVPYPALSVFSLNVNKANYIGHSLLNSLVGLTDIILFQEPWKGRIGSQRSDTDPGGTDVYGMVHQQSWQQYIPVPADAPTDKIARVAAYVTKRADGPTVIQRTDLIQHPDILALEIRPRGSPPFLILNVYNDANSAALNPLTSLTLPPLPTLITGDFNLHSPTWSLDHIHSTASAEKLIEWMSLHNFTLLNTPGEITFLRGNQQSVLDLTWANRQTLEKDLVRDWAIHPDLNICSDHFPTIWFVPTTHTPNPTGYPTGRFKFEVMKASDWIKHLEHSLNHIFTPLLLNSTNVCPDELDQTIGLFHDALEAASTEILRQDPKKLRPNPWFTREVAEAIKNTRAAHRLVRLSKRREHICEQDAETHYRSTRRKLRRVVAKAKRDWALHFAGGIKTSKVWSLNSWYRGIRRYTIPHLSTPDGTRLIEPEHKCQLFHATFFVPPPPVPVDPIDPLSKRANTRPFQEVTHEEVDRALRSSSNMSAPGPSGINYRALKWIWATHPDWIHFIVKWSIQLGVHNDRWKRSTTVVLPKPGKPRYDVPKAYRPIQLLECLGKLVEKIVAKRITFECGKHDILPPEQFGGRSNASCIDAGMTLVNDIEHARKRGLVASILTIDIKGFFDHVNHDRLVRVLWEAGFATPLVMWVKSFLTGRQAAIRVDDHLGPSTPISVGIPQGSPVSPCLSVLYSADVIRAIRDDPSLSTPLGFPLLTLSYVDDFALLAISDSLADNALTLQKGLASTLAVLQKVGMSIDPDKLDLMHFSRKRKGDSPPVPYTFNNEERRVSPKPGIRWLGIFFDSQLTFRSHVKIMCNRARSVINGFKCLSNSVRGLSQNHLRLLYKTCAIPVMTYASPVWFRTDKKQKSILDMLEMTQNHALRLITGCFRTTPIHALQALAHIPPIELTLRRLNDGAAARLSRLPFSSPVTRRLPDDWRGGFPPDHPTIFPTLPSLPHAPKPQDSVIEHLSRRSSPETERMFPYSDYLHPAFPNPVTSSPHFSLSPDPPNSDEAKIALAKTINDRLLASDSDPSILSFFCDGSRMRCGEGKERSGYGVVCYRAGKIIHRYSIGLGHRATVFDAEMYALAHAAMIARDVVSSSNISHIYFYSDSSSAVSEIVSPLLHPSQIASLVFLRHMSHILSSLSPPTVALGWTPGHAGVIGNEEADRTAKQAVTRRALLRMTVSYLKLRANSNINKKWQRRARDLVKTEGTKFLDVFPITRIPPPFFRITHREIYGRIAQTLTGHGYTGEYYARMLPNEPPWCPCSATPGALVLMTRDHILRHCSRYSAHRHILERRVPDLMDPSWLPHLLGTPTTLPALARFLKDSGAFTKLGTPFHIDLILPPPQETQPSGGNTSRPS